jgi:hypothetical protein
MYLPQAASLPRLLGIERDLFRCRHLVEEVELDLAVVGCSVVVPLFPATPLQSRQIEVVTACQFHPPLIIISLPAATSTASKPY